MPQTIQIKRRIGGAAGVPAALAAGELAYNSNGQALYVGADAANTVIELVGTNRQLEIHPNGGNQTVAAGTKTWAAGARIAIAIADLRVLGGAAGDTVTTDGTGNLTFGPPAATVAAATDAEVTAGTNNVAFISPLSLRNENGGDAATLSTTAKTIVPAINELKTAVDALGTDSQFVGSFDATGTTITWVAGTGAGNALPTPTAANQGWYLICEVGGNAPPTGTIAGPAAYNVGDWLISDGATTWTHLAYGGISSVTADQVPLNPAVGTWNDVQAAIAGLDNANAAQDTAINNCVLVAGDTMSGALLLFNATPAAANEAAAKGYVDTKVAGPGASVVNNIALFDNVTGNLLKDSAASIASITADAKAYADTADNLRVLKAGDTMSGPLVLPAAMPTLPAHATHKAYVDQEIAAVAAGASVLVTGPELTGTGLAGNEITFTGITAEAGVFGGLGLSTDALTLLLVDGGTY